MLNLLDQFDKALRVDHLLANHVQYLAHLPNSQRIGQVNDETLAEHMDVVLRLARELSQQHVLAPVVNILIRKLVSTRPLAFQPMLMAYILDLFVGAIAFHDFGKVNEHFQKERMKNVLFQGNYQDIFNPVHGHSELSAYIFAVYHLEHIEQGLAGIPEDERVWLSAVALLFTNPILLHHSSRFESPKSRIARSQYMKFADSLKRYITLYQFADPNISEPYFAAWSTIWDTFTEENTTAFSIFTLLRLNFSLLTAADYLATSEYMNQAGISDFGVLNQVARQKLIHAARSSKSYNTHAFQLADDAAWHPTRPTERNNETLNALRLEMAVQAIRQVRQYPEQRLFYLEAPTGGGKTNISALVTAELLRLDISLNKIFYVFPFTTLITQTHKALQETWQLEDSQIGLLHSQGGFQQKEPTEEGDYGKQWKNQLANLFAFFPVCLLTHIRFFDILKSNEKDSIYLMHRLANSVVVIDELQSYSPKHWDKMLFWLDQYSRTFNIRFVLMSATLPRIDGLDVGLSQRPQFVDLLPDAKRYFQNPNFRDRVRFRFDLLETPNKNPQIIKSEALAEVVLEQSKKYAQENNGRVFTIVEFIYKKSATDFAGLIGQTFFDKVFVLSGTILEPRRREIINFLKQNAKAQMKVLLITTQVVEAGVDIDMDLGFKNISLIDSDEQLAGRVNRNVTKDVCNVFLFKMNEPGILYKHDDRFDITREKLTIADHKQILETKDFSKLYNQVLAGRNDLNQKVGIENFSTKYLPDVQQLDYESVHKNFQLIEQKNLSIFVPLPLPILIEGEKAGTIEEVFSKVELDFLEKYQCYWQGDKVVDGKKVWTLYRQLNDLKQGITESQVTKKIMQGILSKFTFSIFYTDTIKRNFTEFIDPDKSFDNYLYLEFHERLYNYKTGLDMAAFGSSENAIL
ncbi:CRISPR-associated helicase Cas3' [Siphonobacter sp. SORGH_AS_1065]|uniref:CRISPR-associated helicase Cas3' n=1 Tax=Siphonobacter sp. SORGH_AS_1065 TaxID=3041795 RepID=UPI002786EE6A|nr:CRISPR-associated helicase Cas3' [Siphonobacter sp. SORGH_AS_1065]MDQ1089909.1 CRISPR-associated endonuclease/helicase Cas3 [Siphonobacter sp. SORGH_AS_1065]